MTTLNIIPEAVIQSKVDKNTFLRRTLPPEMEKRKATYEKEVSEQKQRERERKILEQEKELKRWRQRNIGGIEDDDEPAEDEEPIATVNEEDITAELSTKYEEEVESAETIFSKISSQQIPIFSVNCSPNLSVVLTSVALKLKRHLPYRSSLLTSPYLLTKTDAERMLRHGTAILSPFRLNDPVIEFTKANGESDAVKIKSIKRNQALMGLEEPDDLPPKKLINKTDVSKEQTSEDDDDDITHADPSAGLTLEDEELEELIKADEQRKSLEEASRSPRYVFFDGFIYFLKTDHNVIQFLENPKKIAKHTPSPRDGICLEPQRGCKLTINYTVPNVVAVIGEPDEGEGRTLAEQVAYNLNVIHIDKQKLIKSIIKSNTVLASHVRKLVVQESEISTKIFSKMISMRLSMSDVQVSGCVLDGIPDCISLAESLCSGVFNTVPIQHVIVRGDTQFAARWQSLEELFNKHFYDNILNLQQKNTAGLFFIIIIITITLFLLINQITKIETPTPLAELITTLRAVEKSITARKELTYRRFTGQAADLRNTSIRESSIKERLYKYKNYCAAEWIDNKQLVDCTAPGIEICKAEYGEDTYCFSSPDKLQVFLNNPSKYRDDSGLYDLPTHLPTLLPLENAEDIPHEPTADWKFPGKTSWEYNGFCPVELFRTRDDRGLKGEKQAVAVFGSNEYAVSYQDKNYRMSSNEARDQFIKQPWIYIEGSALPKKLPVLKDLLSPGGDVSTEGYIRETLYEAVVKAMLATAKARPGFPGCSLQSSGLRYLAIYLRANNPTNTQLKDKIYKKNLADYTEACSLADFFLSAEAQTADKELIGSKTKLWHDIKNKTIDPSKYEKLNIGE